MSAPVCSVVVVNWNTKEDLLRCLAAIAPAAGDLSAEIIVVDNASTDGSVEAVRRSVPQAAIIAGTTNEGFAAGVNRGILRAAGTVLCILNPDIVLPPGSLPRLLGCLESRPGAGAVMPALAGQDGDLQEGYVRRLPGVMQVLLFSTLLAPLARRSRRLVHRWLEVPVPREGAAVPVEQIPGACMLVRRKAVEDVGLLDEEYRLFFEDVDWSRRLRDGGWTLLLDPGVRAEHRGGASFVRVRRHLLAARFGLSSLLYFRKHNGTFAFACAAGILTANALFSLPVRVLQLVGGGDQARARAGLDAALAFLAWEVRRFVLGRDLPLAALTEPAESVHA